MKRLLLIACVLSCTLLSQAKDWTQYVNPLMGSQSTFELSTGNTYPAIARPWGMNFWTPQTGKMGDGWQYTYTANKIRGFKQTHQPSPWINDYGQFSIMPIVGQPLFDEEKRASWFAHKGEVATPYYYKVYLAEHDIVTEMTPTERAVLFRFTFPENDHSYVVVDAFDKGSYIKILPEENKIIGYTTRNSGGVPENFKNYFIIEFDKPFTYKATVENGNLQENVAEQMTDHAGAIIGFKTRKGEQVNARIASSFISFEQAAANMNELGKDNIEQLAQKGKEDVLKCIVENAYSRIPVYAETRDNIKGVLYIKDLLPHLNKGDNFRWQSLIRPAYFVPETKMIDDLLRDFQANKIHIAIVVDEFGGTSGIVTMEDIIEEIVGEIRDEYDDEERTYAVLNDHTWVFEAKTQLTDFYKITKIDEETFDEVAGDADTLAGLLLELKGEFPALHEKVTYDCYEFEVLEMDNRRILKVKFTINEPVREGSETEK